MPIVTGIAANLGVTKHVSITELRLKLGTTAPAGGRTVTSASTYLDNNAVFNVKDFGAFGDGVTVDTTFVQNAINAASAAGGGIVFFPVGTYKVSALAMTTTAYNGVTLRGASMRGSKINFTTTTIALTLGANPGGVSQVVVEQLWLTSTTSNTLVEMLNASQCTFSRLYIDNTGNAGSNSKGWNLFACMATLFTEVSYGGNTNAKYGFFISADSDATTITHCYLKGEPTNADYTIVINGLTAHVNTVIEHSVIGGAKLASIIVALAADASLVQIRNNYFETCVVCIQVGNPGGVYYGKHVEIEGNYFYNATSDAIQMQASKRARITNNFFNSGVAGYDILIHATPANNIHLVAILNTPHSAGNHLSIPANLGLSYYQDGNGYLHDRLNYVINTDAWNPGSIAVGASLTRNTTVTGAALGDLAIVGISLSLAGLTLTAYVSAADTVTTVLSNTTAGAVDLALFDMNVKVAKY